MTMEIETPNASENELATFRKRITELEQTVMRLWDSEQRFRQLFERSPDAIFVEDLAANVLDANAAACPIR
jgi:PAS domain-containing protein